MAERRSRIGLYLGPRGRIPREDLPKYEGGWVAEIKHDGEWCVCTFEDGAVVSTDSRTGLPLAGPVGHRPLDGGSGQLVGELVGGRVHLFEILNWNGMDFRDLGLEDRREALEMLFRSFDLTRGSFALVERRDSGFLAWYDSIMVGKSKVKGERPEGLVLKRRGSPGRAMNADGKVDFQLKCKPLNAVEYVVLGPDGTAEKGTPKIALGLYFGGELRKCMSPTWPAGMDLRPGMVVEVEGAEVFPSGAVRHGHVKRIRDKDPRDCTIEVAMEA